MAEVSVCHTGELPVIKAPDECWLVEIFRNRCGAFSLAKGWLYPGESSVPHWLDSPETYYFLSGSGIMTTDGTNTPVCCGDAVTVPSGTVQHVCNTGDTDLSFLCIVAPPWDESTDHRQ